VFGAGFEGIERVLRKVKLRTEKEMEEETAEEIGEGRWI